MCYINIMLLGHPDYGQSFGEITTTYADLYHFIIVTAF